MPQIAAWVYLPECTPSTVLGSVVRHEPQHNDEPDSQCTDPTGRQILHPSMPCRTADMHAGYMMQNR